MRLPGLTRRIEEQFPPRGGAPPQPPLPEVSLIWRRRGGAGLRMILAAIAGGGLVWALHAGSWLP